MPVWFTDIIKGLASKRFGVMVLAIAAIYLLFIAAAAIDPTSALANRLMDMCETAMTAVAACAIAAFLIQTAHELIVGRKPREAKPVAAPSPAPAPPSAPPSGDNG